MQSVLALLAERVRTSSTPGNRTDGARLALVIEGGSARGAYSGGMVMALEAMGLLPRFDAVYGSSAGAVNGAWLLCERARQSGHAWWDPDIMRKVINPRRALTGGAVVDNDHLIRHIYEDLVPMGFSAILDNAVEFHPLATDAATGESVDLRPLIVDKPTLQTALVASTAIPLLSAGPVQLGGRTFIDAGVSEGVPVRTARRQGATHIIALRTRRIDDPASALGFVESVLITAWAKKRAPGATAALRGRADLRAEEEGLLVDPTVLQIRPPLDSPAVGSTERDVAVLRAAVNAGYLAADEALAVPTGCEPDFGSR